MNAPAHLDVHTPALVAPAPSTRIRWFMAAAWLVILVKCTVVTWAVNHWQMPFNAAWIVIPTLVFAALATVLWLAHRE